MPWVTPAQVTADVLRDVYGELSSGD